MFRQVIYIEGAVLGGGVAPPKLDSTAQLRTADLVVIDLNVQSLIIDLEIFIGLVKVNLLSIYLSNIL